MFLLKQGEWVWLKKFEAGTAPDLRPSSLSLLRKVGMQREAHAQNALTDLDWSLLS